MNLIVSVDPGLYKCGVVLADLNVGHVLEGRIIPKDSLIDLISSWAIESSFKSIVLGNGTSSKYWEGILLEIAPVQVVEEYGTTLRARYRYWELWPPSFFLRWIPRSLMPPPRNLDAVAALVLLEDYLGKKLAWTGPSDFRI